MVRNITLDGRTIEVNSSMGWLYLYRNQFGHDILPDLMPILEAVVAGIGEFYESTAGKDHVDQEAIQRLMDSDAIVDMFIKLAGMEITTLLNVLWAMAKNADAKTEPPQDFINSFERLPVDELAPALLYIIIDSSISSKNLRSLLPKIKAVAGQSISTQLPSAESTEVSE